MESLGFTFTELRSLAVFLVDARWGWSMEFAPSPEAHAEEYDRLEAHLRTLSPGTYAGVGVGDALGMDTYETPFTLPRCESRRREGKRSWRCRRGVEHVGAHSSSGGGRSW